VVFVALVEDFALVPAALLVRLAGVAVSPVGLANTAPVFSEAVVVVDVAASAPGF
jgi:hypothetical protein